MKIVDNTALLVTTRKYQAIKDLIPKSEILETHGDLGRVLVYWGHNETKILKNLQLKNVPSPILRNYDWPGFYTPFAHQRETSSFLAMNKRCFCFNEQGTGKTSSAIWASDYLMNKKQIKKALVICPLSIMQSAWQTDILKTAMHRKVGIAYGKPEVRADVIKGDYDYVIINYDGVEIVKDAIEEANFDLIIVDEANAYKNPSTRRWKVLASILDTQTHLWMMTGTPASQSPVDAYGLAKLVSPERVPRFKGAWQEKVMLKITQFKWINKPDAQDKVFEALQPAIRFTKKECLDLPPLITQTRNVPLTPQQAKYYRALKRQMLIQAAGEEVTAVNAAANLNKLLQISGGAVYADSGDIIEFDIKPRSKELLEIINQTSNKLIVFVPYRHTIEQVNNFLINNKVSTSVIHGNVSAGKRATIFKRFQEEKDPRVLVIQPQAASHGVTLTEADTVVFWSPVMSVETYLQCVARIDRYGQKNNMTCIHLEGSEVEKRMYTLLNSKVTSHNKLVELYKAEIGVQ
tara:strand:+ start:1526 stop:3082 length:1557 start_codon:yes stop_codon:yes gene_type:complete